jgi:UDP-glucose 4-epimerase
MDVRVGISGGAGFIGSNLAQRLSLLGHEVYVLDNLETGNFENLDGLSVKFLFGDLRDSETVRNFIQENRIQYFFHLGALGSVPRSVKDPRKSFETNSLSTLNVLESVREFDIPLVFTSSSSVYGKNPGLPKNEKDWLSPISPYAASKLASEALISSYQETYGLRVAIFRLFNVYGPRQNPDGTYAAVIPKWILAAFRNEPLIVYGDGEQRRDFTFIDDVTHVMQRTLENNLNLEHPVNLAFGQPKSLNQILDIFSQYFNHVTVKYEGKRNGDIIDSSASSEKLFKLLPDCVNLTSLDKGLLRTFEWYKNKFRF